jgi:hypothetical protein
VEELFIEEPLELSAQVEVSYEPAVFLVQYFILVSVLRCLLQEHLLDGLLDLLWLAYLGQPQLLIGLEDAFHKLLLKSYLVLLPKQEIMDAHPWVVRTAALDKRSEIIVEQVHWIGSRRFAYHELLLHTYPVYVAVPTHINLFAHCLQVKGLDECLKLKNGWYLSRNKQSQVECLEDALEDVY